VVCAHKALWGVPLVHPKLARLAGALAQDAHDAQEAQDAQEAHDAHDAQDAQDSLDIGRGRCWSKTCVLEQESMLEQHLMLQADLI